MNFFPRVCLSILCWLCITASAMAYETAPYTVVRETGSFSLRQYPSLTVAETEMLDNGGSHASFRKLFRYLSGANDGEQKIAMTTPVFMDDRAMRFVLPGGSHSDAPPAPVDKMVVLRRTEPMTVAVHRFRGLRSQRNEQRALEALTQWLKEEGLTTEGEPFFAYYNSPWTPGFMRRNEVMFRLAQPVDP